MAKKKVVAKKAKPKKVKKVSARKARKLEDQRYEALRVARNKEARETGSPVRYEDRDKATWRKSVDPQATYIKTNRPEQAAVKEHMRGRLNPAYDALRLPGDASNFAPIEQNALRNYSQNTIPGLAERFVGMNALDSSGFQQSLAGGAGGLQTELADLRARHGLENNRLESQNYFNALGAYQEPDIDTGFTPGQDSTLRKGAKFVANAAGNFIGNQGGNLLKRGVNALGTKLGRDPGRFSSDYGQFDQY
ncbi:hypothetical protein UFOVP9_15 [uncultured Caudovirales phage]|jgi:hypothetical protein|uniref:Uncharacterized protein n=1 Tax=uncultured Caudovirales phage TaxID=2100421 RepID=A0A6J5KIE4_9CAUD|nr:hypothetical protein UFOVP9_15 [uncultured Caudovirales phage]